MKDSREKKCGKNGNDQNLTYSMFALDSAQTNSALYVSCTFLAWSAVMKEGIMDLRRLYLSCHSRSSLTVGSEATKNWGPQIQDMYLRKNAHVPLVVISNSVIRPLLLYISWLRYTHIILIYTWHKDEIYSSVYAKENLALAQKAMA